MNEQANSETRESITGANIFFHPNVINEKKFFLSFLLKGKVTLSNFLSLSLPFFVTKTFHRSSLDVKH